MNRREILTEADRLTSADRNKAYGPPLLNHQRIAAIWSVVLGIEVTPSQVALCMAGVKLARLAQTPDHLDSFIDGAAYMAIAGEIATEENTWPAELPTSSPASTEATATSSPSSSTTGLGMLTTLPGHSDQCCRTSPAPTY